MKQQPSYRHPHVWGCPPLCDDVIGIWGVRGFRQACLFQPLTMRTLSLPLNETNAWDDFALAACTPKYKIFALDRQT